MRAATALGLVAVALLAVECQAVDFKKYKTCKACIDAGYGWCPIRRTCGGFANTNCGEGERYYTEDYGEELLKKEKKKKKKKKNKVPDAELPDVQIVRKDEFSRGDGLWLLNVCADWSDKCKAFAPEFAAAAKALRGFAKFGFVDADKELDLTTEYDVSAYPSVVVLLPAQGAEKKGSHSLYEGPLTASALIAHAKSRLRETLLSRGAALGLDSLDLPEPEKASGEKKEKEKEKEKELEAKKKEVEEKQKEKEVEAKKEEKAAEEEVVEAKKDEKKKKKKGKKKKKSKKKVKKFAPGTGEHVERLTAEMIKGLSATQHATLVHVFDKESDACSATAEAFDAAATSLRGVVKFGSIPSASGLPHGMEGGKVYLFAPGAAQPSAVSELTTDAFVSAANAATPAMQKVKELTTQQQFEECSKQARCILVVLPHISGGVAEREAQISAVTEAAGLARTAAQFLWMEAGQQTLLETRFDVLRTPSAVVLDTEEQRGGLALLGAGPDVDAARLVELALAEDTKPTAYANLHVVPTTPWDGSAFEYPQ